MNARSNTARRLWRVFAVTGHTMKILPVAALLLTLVCVGCGTHDASDPQYGEMFKKTTRDRVQGTEFWGSRTDKDCTPGLGWAARSACPRPFLNRPTEPSRPVPARS